MPTSEPRLIIATNRNNTEQRVMTRLTVAEAVGVLRGLTGNTFAQSLAHDHDKFRGTGGLKHNKAAWALVVAQQHLDRAARPPETRTELGNFEEITRLFQRPRLKHPKIALQTADGRPVVLSVAGPGSKTPGHINVTSGHKFQDPTGRFYGRIAPDGTTGVRDEPVLTLLGRFAADPAGVAAEYGKLTGHCCFCSLQLTDDRSLTVGYGPVCADHYNLPWGERLPKAERSTSRADLERPAAVVTAADVAAGRYRVDQPQTPLGSSYLDGLNQADLIVVPGEARHEATPHTAVALREHQGRKAAYAAQERRQEEAGFLSDPDLVAGPDRIGVLEEDGGPAVPPAALVRAAVARDAELADLGEMAVALLYGLSLLGAARPAALRDDD